MKQLKESILAGGIAESILDSDFDAPDLLFERIVYDLIKYGVLISSHIDL